MISTIIDITKKLKQEYNKNNILLYITSCVIIQKYYKGYYIRRKIKIFNQFPKYVQKNIILNDTNYLYINYFYSKIINILYKNLRDFRFKYIYHIDIRLNKEKYYFYLNYEYYNEFYYEYYNNLSFQLKNLIKYYKLIKTDMVDLLLKFSYPFNNKIIKNVNKNDPIINLYNTYYTLYIL